MSSLTPTHEHEHEHRAPTKTQNGIQVDECLYLLLLLHSARCSLLSTLPRILLSAQDVCFLLISYCVKMVVCVCCAHQFHVVVVVFVPPPAQKI